MLCIVLLVNLLFAMLVRCTMSEFSNDDNPEISKRFINWFFMKKLPSVFRTRSKTTSTQTNTAVVDDKPNELPENEVIRQYAKKKNKKNILGNPIFDDNGNLIILNHNGEVNNNFKGRVNGSAGNMKRNIASYGTIFYRKAPDDEKIVLFERQGKLLQNPRRQKRNDAKGELCTESESVHRGNTKTKINKNKQRDHIQDYSSSSDSDTTNFDSSHYDEPTREETYSVPRSERYMVNEYYRSKPHKRKTCEISMYQVPNSARINPVVPVNGLNDTSHCFAVQSNRGIHNSIVGTPTYTGRNDVNFNSK